MIVFFVLLTLLTVLVSYFMMKPSIHRDMYLSELNGECEPNANLDLVEKAGCYHPYEGFKK